MIEVIELINANKALPTEPRARIDSERVERRGDKFGEAGSGLSQVSGEFALRSGHTMPLTPGGYSHLWVR